MIKQSTKLGFGFGLTSAIITTLGLFVGLNSTTHSKLVVLGGILTIAIADAFSDALGIHISQESLNNYSQKEVWRSTVVTFVSKLLFALTFIIPVLLFPLSSAVIVSIVYGLSLLGLFSYYMGKKQGVNPWGVVSEHVAIGLVVIIISNFVGVWISSVFR